MQNRVAGMASSRSGDDRLAARLAGAVGAGVELVEGALHVVELLAELAGQDHALALLGRHLPAVGEVLVVGLGRVADVELVELARQLLLFADQLGAKGRERLVVRPGRLELDVVSHTRRVLNPDDQRPGGERTWYTDQIRSVETSV